MYCLFFFFPLLLFFSKFQQTSFYILVFFDSFQLNIIKSREGKKRLDIHLKRKNEAFHI